MKPYLFLTALVLAPLTGAGAGPAAAKPVAPSSPALSSPAQSQSAVPQPALLLPTQSQPALAQPEPIMPAAAATEIPVLRVPRVSEGAIKIDGFVNEAAWASAPVLRLQSFWPTRLTSEQTQVRVLHTGRAILVSFVCEDAQIVSAHSARDDHTFRDDCAEIFFGAPLPNPLRESLNIEVNPGGFWADVLFRYPNWLNYDWNPEGIAVATQRTQTGWSMELSVPFEDIAAVTQIRGYGDVFPESMQDFRNARELLGTSPPARLRANFARWHRPENAMTIWQDPVRPTPHPLEPDRYAWLEFE